MAISWIESLARNWGMETCEVFIVCPCSECSKSKKPKKPALFSLLYLRQRFAMGEDKFLVECPESLQELNVPDLLLRIGELKDLPHQVSKSSSTISKVNLEPVTELMTTFHAKQMEAHAKTQSQLDTHFQSLLNKVHGIKDFQNMALLDLKAMGDRLDNKMDANQDKWEGTNAAMTNAIENALIRLGEINNENAQEIRALLNPAEEFSKGRKFLQAVKFKLPVIGLLAVGLASGVAAPATVALLAALAGSIEFETNADVLSQKLIKLFDKPNPPLPPASH